MSRTLRWFGKYCPHPPNPFEEGKCGSVPSVGVRRLVGLALGSIPVRPWLLVPSFVVATLYLLIENIFVVPVLHSPNHLIDMYLFNIHFWPMYDPLRVGALEILVSVSMAWFLMRMAVAVVAPNGQGRKWTLGQLKSFMILVGAMFVVSIGVNMAVISVTDCCIGADYNLGLKFLGISYDSTWGIWAQAVNDSTFAGFWYSGSPWFATLDLLAMGVSRGFVLSSAVLLPPFQVLYFLTMAGIMLESRNLSDAFLEALRVIRVRPKQFVLLCFLFIMIAVPFESFWSFASFIAGNWVPWMRAFYGTNANVSLPPLLAMFQTFSDSLVGPALVYYLRAFLAPVLMMMVFYHHRSTLSQAGIRLRGA
jgi:hypothetical protein